ncbi:MAG: aldo/keto reductase [Dehalococcoidia bacterium]
MLTCAPLGGGTLGARGEPALLERLKFLTDGAPRSVAQAALAWVLSDHRLAATIAGPSTVAHALDLASASALAPLDELTITRLTSALRAD